jgi:hypothetical protein
LNKTDTGTIIKIEMKWADLTDKYFQRKASKGELEEITQLIMNGV